MFYSLSCSRQYGCQSRKRSKWRKPKSDSWAHRLHTRRNHRPEKIWRPSTKLGGSTPRSRMWGQLSCCKTSPLKFRFGGCMVMASSCFTTVALKECKEVKWTNKLLQVFCGKIPKELYEDELIPLFEKCGEIWDLRLMMDPMTGQNRGYAFITFTTRTAACEAVRQVCITKLTVMA